MDFQGGIPGLGMLDDQDSTSSTLQQLEQKLEDSTLHVESKKGPEDDHSVSTMTEDASTDDATTLVTQSKGTTHLDPEFLAAAAANKGDQNAEWQFDSNAESSDTDSDTSSDTSSEDSDEDYPLLDPAEQVRILMQEEYGDDEGGKASAAPLRSANEQVEERVEKPDVTVTPDMKITELGAVENIVGNLILIRAKVTGEYRVLESASILCLDNRSVIGVVAETLGRVQEPLYSVAFNTLDEIAEAGISKGTTIYYVDQHSTYVFTQALKAVKGSDASNQFDEEVGAHEVEFSDDEAEAEYKRQMKQKKRAAQDGQTDGKGAARGDRVAKTNQPPPYTGALSYDDDEGDMYTPLTRPDNFHQMMGPGGAPVEHLRSHRAHGSKGRGDRSGRGRGGRSRGDLRHDAGSIVHSNIPTQSAELYSTYRAPATQTASYPATPVGQQSSFQFSSPQSYGWPQIPTTPLMFGANTQYPSSSSQTTATTDRNLATGAFVNPSFFQGQQQPYREQLMYPSAPAQQTPQWSVPPPQQAAQFLQLFQAMAAANQANSGQGQQAATPGSPTQSTQDVAEILRKLSNSNAGHS